MKELKKIGWLYEFCVLRPLFYQTKYCEIWNDWLVDTLCGDYSFLDDGDHTVKLMNNQTGVTRRVWISNHPYSSIYDYKAFDNDKKRPLRNTANLFISKYNEYVRCELKIKTEAYRKQLNN